MKLTLNIYRDAESEQPTKTYSCFRITMGQAKKAQSLRENVGENQEDQMENLLSFIELIFPTFDKEDFDFIDPLELTDLIMQVNKDTDKKADIAQKK